MNKILQLAKNLFIAVDQLINTLLLGHPDETLSSRLGRAKDKERYVWVWYLRWFVNYLFFFDYSYRAGQKVWHCENSIQPLEQQNFRNFDYEIWSWQNED